MEEGFSIFLRLYAHIYLKQWRFVLKLRLICKESDYNILKNEGFWRYLVSKKNIQYIEEEETHKVAFFKRYWESRDLFKFIFKNINKSTSNTVYVDDDNYLFFKYTRYLLDNEIDIPRHQGNAYGKDVICYLAERLLNKRYQQIIKPACSRNDDSNELHTTIWKYNNRIPHCSRVGCKQPGKAICGFGCHMSYCSQTCAKECWGIHSRFCAKTYMERLILFIQYRYKNYPKQQYSLNKNSHNHGQVSSESIFRNQWNPKDINSYRCIICQKYIVYHYEYSTQIVYRYCELCKNVGTHSLCDLPHSFLTRCPLANRFHMLLLSFPHLQRLPKDVRKMIFEIVKNDFKDSLYYN
jgi:hypothetical protein